MKLIVGLGNPGKRYQPTRHNVGFLVVDCIARRRAITVRKKICHALTGEWTEGGEKILLAKPQTYMNRSGASVKELLREFCATPDDLVVVYDDLDLPFGRIRIRTQEVPVGTAGWLQSWKAWPARPLRVFGSVSSGLPKASRQPITYCKRSTPIR